MATAWTQNNFRLRFDDGGEVSASWMAASNTNVFKISGTRFRVRFDVSETGTTAATLTCALQANKNGGAFQAVTASSTIAQVVQSQNSVDNVATTQQVSAGTFVAGDTDDRDGVCEATASIAQNSHTELEFCVQLVPTSTAADDAIQLRGVVSPSTAFGTYTNTPTVTVAPPLKLNDYAFVKVGSGLSTAEKIR